MEINKTLTDTMMGEIRVEDIQANWNIAIQGTGLKPDDLGREVMMYGRKMRICGWDYAAKWNVLLTEVSTGKHFRAPVRPVAAAIQAEAGEALKAKTPEATTDEEG